MLSKVIALSMVATAAAISTNAYGTTDCSGEPTTSKEYKSNTCITTLVTGMGVKLNCVANTAGDGTDVTTVMFRTTDCSDEGASVGQPTTADTCKCSMGGDGECATGSSAGSTMLDCSAGSMVAPTMLAAVAAVAALLL
jgi:hypothetical protein